ncbi:polysaccharide biosynthesis tyrosine autokinase [Coraliomargarita parva]|uniref:polysaccharide biosynthesis tyrosine autokinase n=1 Tax=Coraliomargarita parva TaxID=3014050 RepID=UPI0022B50A1A|nr:polysaccharide biosynthesis tyrosine autokinase [Coraliomargarita parva]
MDDLFQDDSKAKSVDYSELLHKFLYRTKTVLRCHWWILPTALALGVAYKAIEGYLEEPYYQSDSQMIMSGRIALPSNEVYSEERDNFFGTQIELMTSDQVKARSVERVRLMNPELYEAYLRTDAYKKEGLKTISIDADVKDDTNIFELTAYGPHPEFTQAYLDSVMEEYINRRSEMRTQTSERTYEALVAQLKDLETEIDTNEDAIVEFQKKNNIVFIQEQGSNAGTYLADLKRRLAELKTESRALASLGSGEDVEHLLLNNNTAAVQDNNSRNALVDAVGSEEDNQKYLMSKEQLEQLQAELEEFSIYLKPKHPKIIELKDQIERTQNQLRILRRQALVRIAERREVVKSLIQNLNEEISIWEQSALENSRLIAEFERLQSRLARSKAAYAQSQDALRAIDANENLQQETVTILEPARHPRPAGQGMVRRFAEGTLYGIILGGGLLFLLGSLDNRILSASEVSAHFEEPLFGAIPYQAELKKDQTSTGLLKKGDDRYVFAEACRNLRTSVYFLEHNGTKPSVLAVTSAVPSEGKSTVSANLAIALSFSKSRVLLVDADLRRGRLHKLFDLRKEKGLADILEEGLPMQEAIQSTEYSYLDFISIGDYPEQPAELLMSRQIDGLIEQARSSYDFVIFDTAPILATDDTTCFANKVDAVLFAIRSAYTQIRQIRPALGRLHEHKINVSGLILNCVDTSQPGYYYYRYSEYYTDTKRNRSETTGTGI